MQNKRILLTGATGFLGRTLAESLSRKGYLIDTLGRHELATFRFDFQNPMEVDINEWYPIVMHVAGKAHSVPRTPIEEKEFFDVNLEGTKRLCNSFVKSNSVPSSFIFISSVAVYGLDEGKGIAEDHPLNGTTPYAKSKILAEAWLEEWAKKNGVKLTILRLPLIAGKQPPGNLGTMIKGIKSGKYLSIGLAEARKSIVWGEDIADLVPELSNASGVFNLTDGHHPSFHELESVISKCLGKKEPVSIPVALAKVLGIFGDLVRQFPINSDKLNKITSTLTFDDRKARHLLKWQPNSVIEKLRETL